MLPLHPSGSPGPDTRRVADSGTLIQRVAGVQGIPPGPRRLGVYPRPGDEAGAPGTGVGAGSQASRSTAVVPPTPGETRPSGTASGVEPTEPGASRYGVRTDHRRPVHIPHRARTLAGRHAQPLVLGVEGGGPLLALLDRTALLPIGDVLRPVAGDPARS